MSTELTLELTILKRHREWRLTTPPNHLPPPGRRVVNQTVKKLLRSRLPSALRAKDDDASSASGSIAPLPPAKPFQRRAGGLPDLRGGVDGSEGGGSQTACKTGTTSAASGVSAASTEWKTLVKKIHYRNVKRYTQVWTENWELDARFLLFSHLHFSYA